MSGGIKAWESNIAVGAEDTGLELFSGSESPEDILVVAYSLEDGLRDFYQSMIDRVASSDVKKRFQQLSDIEVKHKKRVFEAYTELTGSTEPVDVFENDKVARAVEGGLSTDEYIQRFRPDLESEVDVISLAMSIEAQALDLYQRTAENSKDQKSKAVLDQIAREESEHLAQLGQLMQNVVP
jgi:rubrerythrin